MKKIITPLLTGMLLTLIILGVRSNILEQKAVDHSKLPEKVEENRGFQRWITNLKNKGFEIEADAFKLKEENEIYNLKWIKVYSADDEEILKTYQKYLETLKNTPKVVFSPSERLFIDYRNITRDGYESNEVHFLGQRDDKIIDARILDCSIKANCYFDMAYFLDNDVFVVSEISRNISKYDEEVEPCSIDDSCEYTFKVHVIDLVNNQRLVYESPAFEGVVSQIIPEL